MIEPKQKGQSLLDDIRSTSVQPEQVAIWWLGQSGYAIKTASVLFYVDLYLSEHLTAKYQNTEKPHIRMTEAPIRGHDLTDALWIFASHKHSDHLDPGTLPDLFNASPDSHLILPAALLDHAAGLGLARERLIGTRGDETFSVGPMTVHSIPSSHPGLDFDPATGYPFQGFVFEVDGLRLYHSGDTVLYPGLEERLRSFDPDIMFLPINGTTPRLTELQVPPNMSARDAVTLSKAVNPRLTIPHHYDMFTFNTVNVSEFTEPAIEAKIPFAILQCGERFLWDKPSI
jgi:L-ascorbate metabolism protein UlaG (beta-lactamase superfamily)